MSRKPIIIAAFLLQGCIAQSDIQAKYMAEQDDCRSLVQRQLSSAPNLSGDAAALSAGARFSECMNKVGWSVSTPRPGGTQVAQNPPTGSPSTNPSAALSTTAPPATGGIAPSEGTATIVRSPSANPPSGAPSTNPSAAAARQTAPPPAAQQAQPVAAAQPAPPPPPQAAPAAQPAAAAQPAPQQAPRITPPQAAPAALRTPAPAATSGPAPATYQPSATPAYGQGAGRQF